MTFWQGNVLFCHPDDDSTIETTLAFGRCDNKALIEILSARSSFEFAQEPCKFDDSVHLFTVVDSEHASREYKDFCAYERERYLTARVFEPFQYEPLVCKVNAWLSIVLFYKDGSMVGTAVDTRSKRKRKRSSMSTVASKRHKPLRYKLLPKLTLLLLRIFQKAVGKVTNTKKDFTAFFPKANLSKPSISLASEELKTAVTKCLFSRDNPLQSAFLLAMALSVYSTEKQDPVDFADEDKQRIIMHATGLTVVDRQAQELFYKFINARIDDVYRLLTNSYAWCDWAKLYAEYQGYTRQDTTQRLPDPENASSGALTL